MYFPLFSSETEKMKLYTIYSPPEHEDQVIHKTKKEAVADDEHFKKEFAAT